MIQAIDNIISIERNRALELPDQVRATIFCKELPQGTILNRVKGVLFPFWEADDLDIACGSNALALKITNGELEAVQTP